MMRVCIGKNQGEYEMEWHARSPCFLRATTLHFREEVVENEQVIKTILDARARPAPLTLIPVEGKGGGSGKEKKKGSKKSKSGSGSRGGEKIFLAVSLGTGVQFAYAEGSSRSVSSLLVYVAEHPDQSEYLLHLFAQGNNLCIAPVHSVQGARILMSGGKDESDDYEYLSGNDSDIGSDSSSDNGSSSDSSDSSCSEGGGERKGSSRSLPPPPPGAAGAAGGGGGGGGGKGRPGFRIGRWSNAEVQHVNALLDKHGYDYEAIAKDFPTRSITAIEAFVRRTRPPPRVRGPNDGPNTKTTAVVRGVGRKPSIYTPGSSSSSSKRQRKPTAKVRSAGSGAEAPASGPGPGPSIHPTKAKKGTRKMGSGRGHKWTPGEKQLVYAMAAKYGRDFEAISIGVGTRSSQACKTFLRRYPPSRATMARALAAVQAQRGEEGDSDDSETLQGGTGGSDANGDTASSSSSQRDARKRNRTALRAGDEGSVEGTAAKRAKNLQQSSSIASSSTADQMARLAMLANAQTMAPPGQFHIAPMSPIIRQPSSPHASSLAARQFQLQQAANQQRQQQSQQQQSSQFAQQQQPQQPQQPQMTQQQPPQQPPQQPSQQPSQQPPHQPPQQPQQQ